MIKKMLVILKNLVVSKSTALILLVGLSLFKIEPNLISEAVYPYAIYSLTIITVMLVLNFIRIKITSSNKDMQNNIVQTDINVENNTIVQTKKTKKISLKVNLVYLVAIILGILVCVGNITINESVKYLIIFDIIVSIIGIIIFIIFTITYIIAKNKAAKYKANV